ncbi:MAG: hypothetical protein ACE37F_00905 [Nannocystaceae bacterium]|nr:hypothetical protein [bacterium]
MAHSESWQDFYRRKVAEKEGVPERDVRVVQRHDHVPVPLQDGTAETFVIELAFEEGGETVTVLAWTTDTNAFRWIRKQPNIETPADAYLAILVHLQQRRQQGEE